MLFICVPKCWGGQVAMKNVAISEDDECWSIAESMVEEIGLYKMGET